MNESPLNEILSALDRADTYIGYGLTDEDEDLIDDLQVLRQWIRFLATEVQGLKVRYGK